MAAETWTVEGFLEHLGDLNRKMKDRQLAFSLGAGASKTSGIPTGTELVPELRQHFYRAIADAILDAEKVTDSEKLLPAWMQVQHGG